MVYVFLALTNEGVLRPRRVLAKSFRHVLHFKPATLLAISSAILILVATRYGTALQGLSASFLGALMISLVYSKLKTWSEDVQIVVWVILILLPFFVFGLYWAFQ